MEPELAPILSYIVAVVLLTITPGVDTAIIVQSCFDKDRKSPTLATIGILLGCALWGIVVALGLGAIITSSQELYFILKSIGAAYLIWLGINALMRVWQVNRSETVTSPPKTRNFLRKGFFANLLNPKVGLFYISLLPQFIPTNASVVSYSMMLVLIHIILSAIWFWLVITTVKKSRSRFVSSAGSMTVDSLTGVVFIGFGIKLLMTAR